MATDILLESGTNEVEILEFYLGEDSYGINVAKVMQILPYDPSLVTEIPDTVSCMLGMFLWRGTTIPFFDLGRALHWKGKYRDDRPIVLVTEFNGITNAFLTDGINRIHRISWEQIQPVNEFLGRYSARITGSVNIQGREILIVDFEHIIAEMFPKTKVGYHDEKLLSAPPLPTRGEVKIILAEDSHLIRDTIQNILTKVGYTHLVTYENGEDAYREILRRKARVDAGEGRIEDFLNLVITDIEMPKLDGLTLCKRIKKEMGLPIPVFIFSSLINEQMKYKCEDVGADATITKPEIGNLVGLVDRHCLRPST